MEKLKKKTKHGLNVQYCWSRLFHRWDDLNTLCELNFAPGKLPQNRVYRDDFPDLKCIFIPFYTQITPENIILSKKHLHILKAYCTDHIKTHNVLMLVIIKEILTKNVFLYAIKFSAPFYTTYTQHTDFLFGPNLVTQKSPDNKFKIFSFTLYPPGAQNKRCWALAVYRLTYRCKWLLLDAPFPS